MISEAILIPKIYARLQEIASNLKKILGESPQTPRRRSRLRRSVRGFVLLPGPLSKIPGSAPDVHASPDNARLTTAAFRRQSQLLQPQH